MAVTHRGIFAEAAALAGCVNWGRDTVLQYWAPLYHDMGIVGGALVPIILGATGILFRPSGFLLSPATWLRTVGHFGVTAMVMPDFGYAYCAQFAARKMVPADVDLSSLLSTCSSAEPVRDRTVRSFVEAFAPHGFNSQSFTPGYGLAETTLAVDAKKIGAPVKYVRIDRGSVNPGESIRIIGEGEMDNEKTIAGDERDSLILYSNGPAFLGCSIQIMGAGGNPVDEKVVGEICVTGPLAAKGYIKDGGEEIDLFPGGQVATGDLGFLHDGELYVIDRLKNVIIRYGKNYAATEIEQAFSTAAEISDNRIMVLETDIHDSTAQVVALVEERKTDVQDGVLEAIRTQAKEMDLPVDQLLFVGSGKIAKTTSGKKRYDATRQALQAGEIDILARHSVFLRDSERDGDPSHDTNDEMDKVISIVASIAQVDPSRVRLDGATNLVEDLGLDSLQIFEVGITVQEKFGVELWEEDIVSIGSISDILGKVKKRREVEIQQRELRPNESRVGLSMIESALVDQVPQLFSRVTEQNGRRLKVEDKEILDFASCNYLGLDLHTDVINAVQPMIEEWGVHPSWTRAVASPEPYFRLEEKLSDILDGLHVAVFPTITLIHMGLLPELAGRGGVIFADNSAHTSIRETCFLAEGKGARTEVWPHMELAALEELLQENMDAPARIIAVDGIYSMSGHLAPLEELLDLADKYDATLYVDDAHGFGVLGEDPSPDAPFGRKGNGSIKYLGLSLHHDRLIYIAGLSKAYSSMGAFVASSNPDIKRLAETSSTYVFSGPVPVASLAGALAGFDIAVDEAEPVQSKLAALTKRFSDGVQ